MTTWSPDQVIGIENKITSQVLIILNYPDGVNIHPDTYLLDYFDSLNVVELIVSLEEEFNIVLDLKNFSYEKFNSIRSITNFVMEILDESRP